LFANFHSADAIFRPRIANRDAAAVRAAAVRTRIDDLLLETSLAYLELLRAHQSRAIALNIRFHANQLADASATSPARAKERKPTPIEQPQDLRFARTRIVRA
jgi:hypothetical protein